MWVILTNGSTVILVEPFELSISAIAYIISR